MTTYYEEMTTTAEWTYRYMFLFGDDEVRIYVMRDYVCIKRLEGDSCSPYSLTAVFIA